MSRKLLISAVLFLGLASYLYFYELPKGAKEENQRLLDFKEEAVESLVLNYPRQEIRLRREPSGRWRLTHPLQAAADEATVGAILSTLSASEIKRTVEEKPTEEDLKNFGLDSPAVRITLTLKRGATLPEILIGAKTPVGGSAYARRGSERRVLLTAASLPQSLEKTVRDFRSKKIIEFSAEAVKGLSLKGTHGDIVIVKKDQGWFIDKPKPYRADRAEVEGLLATLSRMSARDFIDAPPADLHPYGLDNPRLRIALSMGEKEGRREILFGQGPQGRDEAYAALDSRQTIYALDADLIEALDKELGTLRNKEVFPPPKEPVAKLRFRGPQESWLLAKEKGAWKVEEPKRAEAKDGAVENYLAALGRLRAKGFAEERPEDLKRYGLDPPALQVALEDEKGKGLGALLLGSESGKGAYVRREGDPTVYLIEAASYRELHKQLGDFLTEEKKQPSSTSGAKK